MRFLIIFFCFLLPLGIQAKTIYIAPIRGLDENRFFSDPYSYRDETAKPFCALKNALEDLGYTVKFTWDGKNLQDVSAIISFNETSAEFLENISRLPKEICFLFIFEPHVVCPWLYDRYLTNYFGKIFVMFDDIVDNENYFKFYYPQPRQQPISDIPDFDQKKLCVQISGFQGSAHPNSFYYERQNLVNFFTSNHPEDFDFYGHSWSGYPGWKGTVPSKWEVIKHYKFAFCYENMKNQVGYITEKIFDVMTGGAVPIYWGASNIQDYIPKECFIDRRDFSSYSELYYFLKTMDRSTYESYLAAIRNYYSSEKGQLHSIDHWIGIFKKELSAIDSELYQ